MSGVSVSARKTRSGRPVYMSQMNHSWAHGKSIIICYKALGMAQTSQLAHSQAQTCVPSPSTSPAALAMLHVLLQQVSPSNGHRMPAARVYSTDCGPVLLFLNSPGLKRNLIIN
jgi:hypothetical protein